MGNFREHKAFRLGPGWLRDPRRRRAVEEALVRRAAKFACAALNARINGTLHLGVLDGDLERGERHGQVMGFDKFIWQKNLMFDGLSLCTDCWDPSGRVREAGPAGGPLHFRHRCGMLYSKNIKMNNIFFKCFRPLPPPVRHPRSP